MSAGLLALSGPPGSGKSTVGRLVANRLGLPFHAAGDLFRAEATRRGMDLIEFSHYAEEHEEVDRALDERMLALAAPGRVLDGRLVGALCRRRGIPVVYILLTASPDVRAQRLAHRDHETVEEATRRMHDREGSERERYRRIYGIDLASERPDHTIDTSELSVEAVAKQLIDFFEHRGSHPR